MGTSKNPIPENSASSLTPVKNPEPKKIKRIHSIALLFPGFLQLLLEKLEKDPTKAQKFWDQLQPLRQQTSQLMTAASPDQLRRCTSCPVEEDGTFNSLCSECHGAQWVLAEA